MGRARRILRWLGKALLWTVGSVIGLVLLVYLGLISPWGNEFIRAQVEEAAQPAFPGGAMVIGELDTNLLTGLALEDVAILDDSGKALIQFERFELHWQLGGLLDETLVVDTVHLEKPKVDLTVLPDGTLDIQKVLGPPKPDEPSEPWTGLPIDVVVPNVVIANGAVAVGGETTPVKIGQLGLDVGVALDGPAVHIDHLDLNIDMQAPFALEVATEGEVIFTGADVVIPNLALKAGDTIFKVDGRVAAVADTPLLDLGIGLDPLAQSTLELVAGAPVLKQDAAFQGQLTGPLALLTLDSTLSSEGLGSLDLDLILGLESEPLTWDVKLAPKGFQVDGLVVDVPVPVTLDGNYSVVGSGTEWPAGIQAEILFDAGPQVLGGESVARFKLDADLDAGQLQINSMSARHSVAHVDVTGRADLIENQAAIDLKTRLPNLAALAAYGASGLGGSGSFDGHIDASWVPEVNADITGRLSLDDISASGAHIRAGEAEVVVGIAGKALKARGDVQLDGLSASGAKINQVRLNFVADQNASGSMNVAAGLGIQSVAMADGSFEMAGLDGTVKAHVPARGALAAQAKLDVQEFKLNKGAYVVQGGPVAFEAKGDEVWADIDLRRKDAPFLKGRIDGNLATGQWSISGFNFAVKPEDGLVADQDISVTLGEGGAESIFVEIGNPGGRGHLRLQGRATADDPDLHLQAKKVNLTYVMEMVHELMGVEAASAVPEPKASDDDDAFAPVFPGDKGEPGPVPAPEPVAARTEQKGPKAEKILGGLASMDLKVKKLGDAFVATGWIQLEGLVVPDQVEGGHFRVDLDVGADRAKVKMQVSAGKQLVLHTDGDVPLVQKDGSVALACDQELDVRTLVPALKMDRLAKNVPAVAGLEGRVSMDLRVKGQACNPDLALVAATDMPVGSHGERARVDLEFKRVGDKVLLNTTIEEDQKRLARVSSQIQTKLTELLAVLQGGEGTVALDKPESWITSMNTAVSLEAVPLEAVARLADVNHTLEGVLGGGLHIGGSPAKPEVTAGLVLVDGRIGEVDIQRATFEFLPSQTGYRLDSDLVFEGGGALGVHGYLPLDLGTMDLTQPGLDIALTGSGLPLALAAGPSALVDPVGLLMLEGQVKGTLADPAPALGIKTENAGFTLPQLGLRYAPVNVDMDFTPERLDVHRFEMQTKPFWSSKSQEGTFKLSGSVGLDDGELTQVQMVTEMDEFWLSSIKLAALAVSGKLDVEGVYPDLKIRGALQADEARFEVGEAQLAETSGLEMDSSIVVHREKVEVKTVKRAVEEPSVTDNFDVALNIDLKQRLNLKADIPLASDFGSQFSQLATFSLEMTLDGDLDVVQRRGELGLAGDVVPLRGFLEVLGKRFELQEGRLTFTGTNFDNPVLDLNATHQVGQYGSVEIKITGDVDAPSIAFSSTDYPDQTDVMSMLLFGKPTSAMSETEGESGSGLLSAALSTVGGQAARSSGAAFLQNISVDPGSGSVKVGFPLSDKVYLAVERLQPESETDNMTQASVQWILSRRTYAEIITGDQGKSSGDVYWRWRF